MEAIVKRADKRFALIDTEGELRYPYKKYSRAAGRICFIVSNASSGEEFVDRLEDVIKAVVLDGKRVTVTTDPQTLGKIDCTLALNGRQITGYLIEEELEACVAGSGSGPQGRPSTYQTRSSNVEDWSIVMCGVVNESIEEKLEKDMKETDINRKFSWIKAGSLLWESGEKRRTIWFLMQTKHRNEVYEWAAKVMFVMGGQGPATTVKVERLHRLVLPIPCSSIIDFHSQLPLVHAHRRGDVLGLLDPLTAILSGLASSPDEKLSFEAMAALNEINADPACQGLPETARRTLANARIGQGLYRRRMLEIWSGRCAVTNLDITEALIASHAKPWRCSNNSERLDPYNGLLLSASIDKLFDQGFISFADDGSLMVKPAINERSLACVGLRASSSLSKVDERHKAYLAAHRRQFGFE